MKRHDVRNLVLVLGDQLDTDSAAFDGFEPDQDAVWMAETAEEATHVWAHKQRIAFFLSALRQFREELQDRGFTVMYTEMPENPEQDRGHGFAEILARDVATARPRRLILAEPGDWRVRGALKGVAKKLGIQLDVRVDQHFYCGVSEFRAWAESRTSLLLEDFYRHMRKRHEVLVGDKGKPEGGAWNFDQENRESFGKEGPSDVPEMPQFSAHETTRRVLKLVEKRFDNHPGTLKTFNAPVTRRQALYLLRHFIEHALPKFGQYQDAMWTDQPYLFHSRLSLGLNTKLISPRECVQDALEAYRDGAAPLASVEGFIRQILGWREYVRGIYWTHMPEYARMNALEHEHDAPGFYWHGATRMECLRQCLGQVVRHGYAHHIQRLMVLGLFAQLLGVHPYKFHEWHMAMYLDAIDWVSLPNVLGMSQYADGGIMSTKPYCASGKYINRMSNYCRNCPYSPNKTTEEDACPFNALYWDFLQRHKKRFKDNPRMGFQYKNLARKSSSDLKAIRKKAQEVREAALSGDEEAL